MLSREIYHFFMKPNRGFERFFMGEETHLFIRGRG